MSTPIKREDIRKGDRILSTFTEEFTAKSDTVAYETGFTYELIERPVVLPTEPGYYLDRYSSLWRIGDDGALVRNGNPDWRAKNCAPFTLLRTEAETALDLLREVRAMYATDDPTYWGKLDALTAKWATK